MQDIKLVNMIEMGMSNAYILCGEKPILIDTGSEKQPERFIRFCTELDLNPTDIELIVISHEHADHFINIDWIKNLTGAPILCHTAAKDYLVNGWLPDVKPRTPIGVEAMKDPPGLGAVPCIEPDLVIESSYDLKPYGIPGEIIHTPGHSAGSLSVILETGEAIIGDIFLRSHTDSKLVAAFLADDIPALEKSIRLLLEKGEVYYSGHGGPYIKEEVIAVLKNDSLDVW